MRVLELVARIDAEPGGERGQADEEQDGDDADDQELHVVLISGLAVGVGIVN
jgi:hypothetical protein